MYTPKRLRKNAKEISSEPSLPKRMGFNFKKEEVSKKLKLGYTPR